MTEIDLKIINIPNQLTLLRILCVPFFIGSILYLESGKGYSYLPLCIFSIAILTDALDGFFARILNQKTILGTWLDPIADKLLLISAFVLLGLTHIKGINFPIWLWVTVISRDCLIILGAVVIHMMKGKLAVAPSVLGKMTTFLQMAVIFTRLAGLSYELPILWGIAALFTIASGIDYTIKGIKQINE